MRVMKKKFTIFEYVCVFCMWCTLHTYTQLCVMCCVCVCCSDVAKGGDGHVPSQEE